MGPPSIAATPIQKNGKTTLKVEISNSHLKVDENLNVMVKPVFRVKSNGGDKYISGRALYSETLGAGNNGEFEHSFEIEIPPGEFEEVRVMASVDAPKECNEEKSSTSCVLVRLPNRREKPQLGFKWKRGRKGGLALRVHVTAADIPNRALQLFARTLKPKRALLAEARIRPTMHGDVDRTFVLPAGRARTVCVAAFTGKLRLTCPPKAGGQPVWARLRVPGRR